MAKRTKRTTSAPEDVTGTITVHVNLKTDRRKTDYHRAMFGTHPDAMLPADEALELIAMLDLLEAENWRLHEQLLEFEGGL